MRSRKDRLFDEAAYLTAAISAPRGAVSRTRLEPFIDLSTGINPYPYPLPRLAGGTVRAPAGAGGRCDGSRRRGRACLRRAFARLTSWRRPGTQILLPLVARAGAAGPRGGARPDLCRACARRGARRAPVEGGARTSTTAPTRRLVDRRQSEQSRRQASARSDALLALAERSAAARRPAGRRRSLHGCRRRRDRASPADVAGGNVVVLRSFGKFFGLAGLRLGFALAAPPLGGKSRAALGPWAVSGPAIAVGTQALADTPWIERTRARLDKSTQRLDAMLADLALQLVGGTSLFRLVQTPAANALFQHLGRGRNLGARFCAKSKVAPLRSARQRGGLETAQGRARGLLVVSELLAIVNALA